ncbi:Ig-like domain-containing protein [Leucobacter luti]|uniref:Ig-like domain-containing protein n=1 Tax=Leucobacter luti TaxID=340320 RepID=UPI003CFF5316
MTASARPRFALFAAAIAVLLALCGVGWGGATAAHAEPFETHTELAVQMAPQVYGDGTLVSARLILDGPGMIDPATDHIELEINGVSYGKAAFLFFAEGAWLAVGGTTTPIPAGTHELVARFPGTNNTTPGYNDALPSQSDPVQVMVQPLGTTTAITSAPSLAQAFSRVDVAAQVTTAAPITAEMAPLAGSAELLADGQVIATAPVGSNGAVSFTQAQLPAAAAGLSVRFLGSTDGNYTASNSAAQTVELTPIETATTLELSSAQILTDGTSVAAITVRNVDSSAKADPQGPVEILVDGDPYGTVAEAADEDPEKGDGERRLSFDITGLTLGDHQVSARFVPSPGFVGSESAERPLSVLGIPTQLVAEHERVTGSAEHPPTVKVRALRGETPAAEQAPVDGTVQAFVEGRPLGDPVATVDGAAQLTFAGLRAGVHEVELRFLPAEQGFLKSQTRLDVEVTGAPKPAPQEPKAPAPALAKTGGAEQGPVEVGLAALALAAGGAILLAGRRGRA